MELQTQIPLQKITCKPITYNSKLVLLGSCFVQNIANKLAYYKFTTTVNPLGILFHPKAIKTLVTNAANSKTYTKADTFFYNEQWHCFDTHSKLSNTSQKTLLNTINTATKQTQQQVSTATHIIITLGTAWAYYTTDNANYVANCHKLPQKTFTKKLSSIKSIKTSLLTIINSVKKINPTVSIIFTVSPIRHTKDGFVNNTLSKAHLISAVHKVTKPIQGVYYFPSYEIMLDELRDYRFYKEDMLHPNNTAIDYIWNKFKTTWINPEVYTVMTSVEDVQKGLAHKPFRPKSDSHRLFVETLELKKAALQSKYAIVF